MNDDVLPSDWTSVPLKTVCDINPRRPPLDRAPDAMTSFVPMAGVREGGAGLEQPVATRPFAEVAKGYTYFEEGDVLFAKITPCMENGKIAVAEGLIGGFGFGTTEFHILRPKDAVLPEWIHYFLIQPDILKQAEAQMTGAVGQQRLPQTWLAELTIPLPPLAEQRRIVARLGDALAAVERARAAARAQVELARQLPAALLRCVFESDEAVSWPVVPLGDVGAIRSGITLGRKLNGQATMSVPYLRVANVKDSFLDLSDVKEIEVTAEERERYRLLPGDLLLTEGGDPDKLGRGTYWQDEIADCIHQNHIFRVRFDLDRFDPRFLAAQLGSDYGKRYFLAHAKQTTGIATINQRVLAAFPLMAPNLAVQRQVSMRFVAQQGSAMRAIQAAKRPPEQLEELVRIMLENTFAGDV